MRSQTSLGNRLATSDHPAMGENPKFVTWLQDVRDAVAATRATWKSTGTGANAPSRDKRLDHVLPMQFEHDGALIWSEQAHRATLRSALWELTLYVSGLLGVLLLLAIKWLPLWLYIGLGCVFVLAFVMHRIHRVGERPAQLWREQAEVVPGVLVYANAVLYKAGPEPASNAGFVFTFDAELAADPERLQAIARRCGELHDPATRATPEERELQRRSVAWSEDRTPDNPHVFDRVQIPSTTSGNDATFFTMIAVSRGSLVDGVIDRNIYPLLARRGSCDSAELLPPSYWA
ncbi:MAG: hypothetical protein JNL12_07975 [Planctomycetes bacterium]|nr:hypothetical protein [Planctomycetota bacterium]